MRTRLLSCLLLASLALGPAAFAQPKPDAPKPAAPDAAKPDPNKPDPSKPDPSKADRNKAESTGDAARAAAAKVLQKQVDARFAEVMKRGVDACERGDTDEGLESLRSAFVQRPDVDVAAALGTCEAKAGQWPEAAEHLAAALRVKEDGPERKRLEEMFLDARNRVGAVKVTVNVEGADVIVGHRIVGQSPLPGEVFVEAGKRTVITAKKPGHEEAEQSVTVAAKGSASVSFDLAMASSSGDRYAYTRRTMVPFYVLGGMALVAGGVGAALYTAAGAKASAADDLLAEIKAGSSQKYACQPAQTGCATVTSLRESRDQMMNIGTGVFIAGGVLLGAAVLTGVWAQSGSSSSSASLGPRAASLSVAPAFSRDGGGLWLRGGF